MNLFKQPSEDELRRSNKELILNACQTFSMASYRLIYRLFVFGFVAIVPALSFATDEVRVDAGASLFKSHCILCHGADATGNTTLGTQLKARNLHTTFVQKKSDLELKQVITNGNGNMPPFSAQLSAAQIDEVVAYVRHLGKSKK